MRMLSVFFLAAVILFAGQIHAQETDMTKEERKKWKKLAKRYKRNPEALARLTEEREELLNENNQLEEQVEELKSENNLLEEQVNQLESANTELNQDLMMAQSTIRQLQEQQDQMTDKGRTVSQPEMDMSGTVYRIQIGAFEKKTLPEELTTAENMKVEETEGMQKVMVGQFRDFNTAKQLMDYLRKMGVEGAWIVPYRDGQRISLKEALGTEQ